MRLLLYIIISLFTLVVSAQAEHINKTIGIPDSFTNSEIRIYKHYSITNCTEVFRLFEPEKDKWSAELYGYYSAVPSADVEEHFTKKQLTSKDDLVLIWYKMIATDIEYVPDMHEIDYKLHSKPEFYFDEKDGYSYAYTTSAISDGDSYVIYIYNQRSKKLKVLNYGSPEYYLKKYPGVDELEIVKNLIDIIRNNFNVWKD